MAHGRCRPARAWTRVNNCTLKFPADDFSKGQRDAYPDIAGDDRKLAAIGPDDGRCGDADRQSQPSSSAQKQPGLEVMVGDKLPSSGGIMPLMPPRTVTASLIRMMAVMQAERAASANEPGRAGSLTGKQR
ncbi:hypothetical protein [Burkholderia pseudomallei]|uniref:hypothetical protein n=1 Tax=Burkholderia pseudomallei TaxID=28450 RepID=UPI0020C444CB|nr:hypothetical protein [Burkholderia pseudomallei]